jgi:hypothetical protein
MCLRVVWVFLGLTSVLPALAQSNTTAGLAGIGAGAALTSTSPNGTTPSPAAGGGGGGNTPIEIQIMVFQGMKEIASEIAALTTSYQTECESAFKVDPEKSAVIADRAALQTQRDQLATDTKNLRGDRDAAEPNLGEITDSRKKIQDDEVALAKTRAKLNINLDKLSDTTKKACSILLEDSTSSNQIALYQAEQGYYNHLQQLDDKLQPYFALQIVSSLTLGVKEDGTVAPGAFTITNTANPPRKIPRKIKDILVTGSPAFDVDYSDCQFENGYKTLDVGQQCTVAVTFPKKGIPVKAGTSYPATIRITSGAPDSETTNTSQTVQLSATVPAAEQPTKKEEKGKPSTKPGERGFVGQPAVAAASGGASTGGGGGASTTPLGLTYLGDLTTALGALKSNITYGASGFQPTSQSFQLLIEAELKARGMFPYTSTSTLNLQDATDKLSCQFAQMLSWSNEINGWANQCKPPSGGGPAQAPAITNSACGTPGIASDLSVGQQIINGYTTLITQANDGSGSPVIVDVLRGMILSTKIAEAVPSLQVTVASAGGSTKTNNIFGVNLFYTFAPSYNAGVIATYELRDKNNVLIDSGARNSLVAYTKWKSKSFHPGVMRGRGTCDSFCSVQ